MGGRAAHISRKNGNASVEGDCLKSKRIGPQTVQFVAPPVILASASVVGKKEGEGPLRDCFDSVSQDTYFGTKSWEQAESAMLRQCFDLVCQKAGLLPEQLDYVLSGDLLNQCVGSAYAMRDIGVPYLGLYGACSTMAESLSLAAMLIDGGYAEHAAALTSSHFCSAERQYRFPLEYGGVRTPTAQWTVTGSGALILGAAGSGPRVTMVTTGKIADAGITDANNMGAAMAPAAYETLRAHFADTGRTPDYYDLIVTGDLGKIGHTVVTRLFQDDGIELEGLYTDCGLLIYDLEGQDVHAGGSGCGCSAAAEAAGRRPDPAAVVCGDRRAHVAHCIHAGRKHPRNLPRRGDRNAGEHMILGYVKAFLVGAVLCMIGQILIDKTKLTPARILTLYVVAGVVLGAVGVYGPFAKWAGAGATIPLTGFGNLLAKGVRDAVAEKGVLGAFTGGFEAGAAGICAAIFFGLLVAMCFKSKDKQ